MAHHPSPRRGSAGFAQIVTVAAAFTFAVVGVVLIAAIAGRVVLNPSPELRAATVESSLGEVLGAPAGKEVRMGMTPHAVSQLLGPPLEVVPINVSFGCSAAREDYERRFGSARPFVYAYATRNSDRFPDTFLFFQGDRLERVQMP